MDEQPLVSIILPVYNAERYIAFSIESVINQTYRNLEILIVDDASNDRSIELVQGFKDSRIKIVKNEQNSGISASLNKGLSLAIGKYIARMDADDICLPNRIETQVKFLLANPDVAVIDSVMQLMDTDNKLMSRVNSTKISEKAIRRTLPFDNCLGHSSVMLPREIYTRYRYRKVVHEDYDLWLRILNDGNRICKINEPLLHYRVHDASYMSQIPKRRIAMADTKMFYYWSLKSKDKFKKMNLFVLLGALIDYARGWQKWLILNLKK